MNWKRRNLHYGSGMVSHGLVEGRMEGVASKRRVLVSWSSGKDSAWMLYQLRQQSDIEVVGLLTTVNEHFGRVTMHGVRREVLRRQAEAVGLPLWEVSLPWPCNNSDYEQRMFRWLEKAREVGIDAVAFGDLFLEDVRNYRERQLAGTGIEPLFPLWGRPPDTEKLARCMLEAGLEAMTVCIDSGRLRPPSMWLGRRYDAAFLRELPPDVDPCGERGEFHTLCVAGPMFRFPLRVAVGDTVERDGFWYVDVELAKHAAVGWEAVQDATTER